MRKGLFAMTLTTILWDWNGTLADDVQVALRSVNDILARRNRSPITTEDYYSYIDTPIRRFYEHLFLRWMTGSLIGFSRNSTRATACT